ncbi:TfoX N-terminal domain-containing protein [Cribrihabitans marinus]|uniref:TfoX N-terminal domain-containing protein n=1 Tax=Cribrihabitans marinus TaxID=1227549 RepID=A0A1H6VA76_9RHOB|nr:TfoX/Sxy family protein [Cribrihabitans marinus]SEI97560.1 TfoX N-terminal domain-containing protein [Cribrihabitans marinus]
MAYSAQMADTMRTDLGGGHVFTEKKMFGGLCFFLHGNMVCGVGGQGALYRPGKASEAEALAFGGVAPMIMGGARRMGGFVRLDNDRFNDASLRATLTDLSLAHAAGLPPKAATP